MASIPCDVVLLPSKALAEKAIAASQSLVPYATFFTLEIGKYYPHLSLYMFQLEEADIVKVEEVLQGIAIDTSIISAEAVNYKLGEGHGIGYVDPEYKVSDVLRGVQDRVVQALNPVRAGMRDSDIAKMKDATGVKLDNLQKYGYPALGELFRPHITLTRLQEYTPEALTVLPDISTFTGTFDRIGLFEMGDNGTCIRQIAEYQLQS